MTLQSVPVLLAAVISCPGIALAESWYAQAQEGSRVANCIHWPESVAKSVAELERKFGTKCEWRVADSYSLYGYVFKCGPNNTQFMLRSAELCETFKKSVNAGAMPTLDALTPKGLRNPGGYIAYFSGCAKKTFTAENAQVAGYESLVSYCECGARMSSTKLDREITQEFIGEILVKCLGRLDPTVGKLLTSIPTEKQRGKKARAKLSTTPESDSSRVAGPETPTPSVPMGVPANTTRAKVKIGASYEDAMAALVKFTAASKTQNINDLRVTYHLPDLLAYPDVEGGECVLTFSKARLARCHGCSSKWVECD